MLTIPQDARRQAPPIEVSARKNSRARRLIFFPLRLAVGALFTQHIFGAVLIVGWTYRLMQRIAYKSWWRQSRPLGAASEFQSWLDTQPEYREHKHWPNWFAVQNFREQIRAERSREERNGFSLAASGSFKSFGRNLRLGAQGLFNTSLLTLPPSVLLLFAWYAGWQNSFHKGYEYAPIGPLTGLLGIFLLIAALFYLPLAQARQAVTGEWRSFYQFNLIWLLLRRRWFCSVFLAGLYALLSIPVVVLKTAPYFLAQERPGMAEWSSAEVLSYLNSYFYISALLVFPLFVALRMVAARIYAGGILRGLRSGEIRPEQLAANERLLLERTGGLHPGPANEHPRLVRLLAWTGSRAGRLVGGVILFLLWFLFVAQIFISEFLNYHPVIGWLNQPLVQLPFFRYVPFAAENFVAVQLAPALLSALILGGCILLRRIWRSAGKAWTG